jgi:hypothetical protein
LDLIATGLLGAQQGGVCINEQLFD